MIWFYTTDSMTKDDPGSNRNLDKAKTAILGISKIGERLVNT